MSKTLTLLTQRLHKLREMYTIPAEAKETRAEIRRIVGSFESHVANLRYEDLESAAELSSK